MRKKVRNNKTILASILALGCLTAASVGFSSWVIAAQKTDITHNVKVTVADVEDHRFKVTASSDSIIKLGPSTNGKYISYSGSKSEEDLGFKFSLTFNKANANNEAFDFKSLGDQSFDIKFSFADKLNINDAKNTYINFPDETTIGTISKSGFTPSTGVTTATQTSNVITYTGELTWGNYFGNENPSKLNDSNQIDSYIKGLNHLKECLKDNDVFEITVNIVEKIV